MLLLLIGNLGMGGGDGSVTVPDVTPDNPANFGLVAPPPIPAGPEFELAPYDPKVDRDFFALARMSAVQSYLDDVEQWMDDNLADGAELVNVFEDDALSLDSDLTGRKPWRRRKR